MKQKREDPDPLRRRAELETEFGRHGAREHGLVPTDMGCPDCSGVLYVTELGNQGFLSFACRVGHVFSIDSLVEFKEDRVDEALWTTVEQLEELVQLHTALLKRRAPGKVADAAAAPFYRIRVATRHAAVLRKLIRTEGPAPLEASSRAKRRD